MTVKELMKKLEKAAPESIVFILNEDTGDHDFVSGAKTEIVDNSYVGGFYDEKQGAIFNGDKIFTIF